jgi:hypothetical protein
MMRALLLYCGGIYASRRIATPCGECVDFMNIVGFDAPDFRTVSGFRWRYLKALGPILSQILHLCETAGLVKLGHGRDGAHGCAAQGYSAAGRWLQRFTRRAQAYRAPDLPTAVTTPVAGFARLRHRRLTSYECANECRNAHCNSDSVGPRDHRFTSFGHRSSALFRFKFHH